MIPAQEILMDINGPLKNLRVLEIGDFISVAYAGKLLADLGAEVIKLEKPGTGDSLRSHGPFPKDIPHIEKSGLHLFLNTNKKSVTLDLATKGGRDLLISAAADVDLVISNLALDDTTNDPLTYESLSKENDMLVMSSITIFGYDTPYRDWAGTALTATAASGASMKIGNPDKVPLWLPYCAADFQGGIHGAIAALLALRKKRQLKQGLHAWISVVEVMASYLGGSGVPGFVFQGVLGSRDGTHRSGFYPWQVTPAADGFVEVITMVDEQWKRFINLMDNPDWANDPRLSDRWLSFQWHKELDAFWHPWMKGKTRSELFKLFSENRIPFQPVNKVDEIVESEHLALREFWHEIEHPVVGNYKIPGAPYLFSQTPWAVYRPAPRLGEHNDEFFETRLGLNASQRTELIKQGIT